MSLSAHKDTHTTARWRQYASEEIMGSPSSKLLPQSQRTVATHLSAATRSEQLAQKARDDFKKQEEAAGRPMKGGKFPIMGEKDEYITANMHRIMDEGMLQSPMHM